ncbi:MAG TPA: dipeptide ABC transporter ATP-binding protein [Nitrospinota bacterium]|jgi:oligopeptide/dipeptide ABC transporter ATP-binding protein|nr:peptide ABC transporter substrate-binding protein [Nitrospinota bacterium]MDP7369682.1 dipeptide ABC transporter ATP-binding protein [Nitrospinota bacterium]MDP7504934.1 dipeptide ABC transporter ATP-binding protein [Nitrospinota bacterium]MDP7662606.1 dipeptide ABC transporter ATP-binding protein [Nitrospinota bacterium]HJP13463.1 dipeptide ABC transporter ATP-binding protein [Nitrospinota bacterium]|tara:strand:+ start:90 stop:1106 length:1017 start_codon:yes stop_codon:yes gene_type:complete
MAEKLLEVKNLVKHFPVRGGVFSRVRAHVRAVDGISFDIEEGETLGLVGESGCGKSTAGRAILRLIEPTAGEVIFKGINILDLEREKMRQLRREMQIIFQDPYASLNPRMTIGSIVGEPLTIHKIAKGKKRDEEVASILQRVGLRPEHMRRYPHEFSGGQRQRIGIARALALNPKVIIADEPVSALDVSIQAQVINLLQDLQKDFGIAYLVISHDLSVVQHICDRIAVMYLGEIVEIAEADELIMSPRHPYTEALLSAVPVPDPAAGGQKERIILRGDVPSPVNPPSGCRFHTRCPYKEDICAAEVPPLQVISDGHMTACHFAGKIFGSSQSSGAVSA